MKTKPFMIDKQEVWQAWKQVKSKRGTGGVDEISLDKYEERLGPNLYKLWNRMSSGTYFPKPVKRVEIPKPDGGTRPLGIPTVEDRIAQQVVKSRLEERLEPLFHEDSYGYRPEKSAQQAVRKCQERVYKTKWVLDVDIKSYFDTINHDNLMKAVKKHVSERWILLYIERWLKTPVKTPDGNLQESSQGTPQGGVVSPILANLYLHYAFDVWMDKEFPHLKFERYADDMVIHCYTKEQGEYLHTRLKERFDKCGLTLHPEKTKLVCCKRGTMKVEGEEVSFKFLGFQFKPRRSRNSQGGIFCSYTAGISTLARKRLRDKVKQNAIGSKLSWKMEEIADLLNSHMEGWIRYYVSVTKHEWHTLTRWLDFQLAKWIKKKHKLRSIYKARLILERIAKDKPKLFAYWNESVQEIISGKPRRAV